MSTRVQKGGTVFRPVPKARPRTAESTSTQPSASQDNRVSHPPPEARGVPLSIPPDNAPAVVTSPPSTVLHQFSLQGSIDHADPAIVNATKGVPVVVCPPRVTPLTQVAEPRPHSPVEGTSASAAPFHAEVSIVEHQSKRRSRFESIATTSPTKPKKTRRPETPAFDTDADPGEDLDPTSVTMAALCDDTGRGRISSKAAQILDNHLAWKKSNKEKRVRLKLRMEAKKYGRNEDTDTTQVRRPEAESVQAPAADATLGPPPIRPVSRHPSTVEDTSGQGFDYSENVATSRYSVQVRIGPNGETIVDEESLFVDRNAEEDTTEYTHVEESDVTKFINSATYSKRFRGSRWSAEETELFYDALSQFGENYELISYILPGRDRKACKNKFKTEDKKNPQRINYCLSNRKPYDMQTLSRMTGKDFSGPTPEIRAPTALSLAEPQNNSETNRPRAPGQIAGSSSTTAEHVEEVVEDISILDPE